MNGYCYYYIIQVGAYYKDNVIGIVFEAHKKLCVGAQAFVQLHRSKPACKQPTRRDQLVSFAALLSLLPQTSFRFKSLRLGGAKALFQKGNSYQLTTTIEFRIPRISCPLSGWSFFL